MFRSLGARPFVLPAPVLLVGTYDRDGAPNLMTAAWGGICASQPPAAAVSIRKARWTHHAIAQRKGFTLSLPSRDMAAQVDFAGIHSGRDADIFASIGLTPAVAEHVDAPYVEECPAVIELSLLHQVELGSHTQFIGEIMDIKIREDCLREDGLPDPARVDPLLYAPLVGEYWSLGTFTARAHSAGHTIRKVGKARFLLAENSGAHEDLKHDPRGIGTPRIRCERAHDMGKTSPASRLAGISCEKGLQPSWQAGKDPCMRVGNATGSVEPTCRLHVERMNLHTGFSGDQTVH